jgi:hypothetical protein
MEREIQKVVEARSRAASSLAWVLRLDTVRITMDDIYLVVCRGVVDTDFLTRLLAVVFIADSCWVIKSGRILRHVFDLYPSMCSS